MLLLQHELMTEKNWVQMLNLMTEDESGHVRVTEHKALLEMWIEDFFMLFLVFDERLKKRHKQLEELKNKNHGENQTRTRK